ncbi:MAG: hypothetical protein FJ291_09205 [Planctomycetes bacterium]|nr:hypothetical protein [Planctomycetota bacterium]
MASEKQIQANRQNALKSTGPKSAEGKARSARNSLKHGLLSREVLLPGEKAKELAAFREGILAQLAPEGELEELLADRVVESAWRLRRAVRLERQVIQSRLDSEWRYRASSAGTHKGEPFPTADSVAASMLYYKDAFDKLVRYEAHIQRGFYRALHELQRLQAERKGGQAPLPLAVDVDVAGLPVDEGPALRRAAQQEALCVVGGPSPARGDGPSGTESEGTQSPPGEVAVPEAVELAVPAAPDGTV